MNQVYIGGTEYSKLQSAEDSGGTTQTAVLQQMVKSHIDGIARRQ